MNDMDDLKQLIITAKRQQAKTDSAIGKAIGALSLLCDDKQSFEKAEEAMLVYIYQGTSVDDKKIDIDKLIQDIENIII